MEILLNDFIKIQPDIAFRSLSKEGKISLMDRVLNQDEAQRGLHVRFSLSHAGRRINNRVYTTWGQRDGIGTLTSPYPKPILLHHNETNDPIGRFHSGVYEDLSKDAAHHLTKMQDMMALHQGFDSKDYEKLSDSLHQTGVLMNPQWPGLGRMMVTARITDQKAIEKFLDGTYLTFSGGSSTDHMMCSICLQDWAKAGPCDHRPGSLVDGKPAVLMCGTYTVREGSVVNEPADDLSQVSSMMVTQDSVLGVNVASDFLTDPDTIYVTDSKYSGNGVTMVPDTLKELIDWLKIPENLSKLVDDLTGETFTEQMSLIRLHDALHSQCDFGMKYDETMMETLPKDIFKLHGKLHMIASDAGFRDAFVNGPLDNYNDMGEATGEYMYSPPADKNLEAKQVDTVVVPEVKNETTIVADTAQEKVETEAKVETSETQDEEEIDWVLLDNELQVELGDAKLSTTAREKLSKNTFCGPGRSFPVPDCAHVTAARRLIGRAKFSQSTKDRILSCVSGKAKSMSCSEDSTDSGCKCGGECTKNMVSLDKYSLLTEDYTNALNQITVLQEKFAKVLTTYADKNSKSFESIDGKLAIDTMWEWFEESIVENPESNSIKVKAVENPSIGGSNPSEDNFSKLDKFEKDAVDAYKRISDSSGEAQAELWFQTKKAKYLPRGFHPKNYSRSS